jgi:pantetheine-phosphate adenylyltransferase
MQKRPRKAIYAGSFDPLTLGHLDIIKRSLNIVDELIIGVGENIRKKYLFSLEDRISMIESSLLDNDNQNFKVTAFDGLLVDFAQKENATFIVRGIRGVTDFDYEFQMGMANQDLDEKIETIFLLPKRDYIFISSSTVKEVAYFKKDISRYVPNSVLKAFQDKFKE